MGSEVANTDPGERFMESDRLKLQDPRHQYPAPPFQRQPQPVPGLAQQMDPKPDHGETSYVGCGKLVGRKALITGGDSGIGRAVAIAFAREGADVAICYLPNEEPDAKAVIQMIEQAGRKAVAIPGDITDEAFCQKLVAEAVEAIQAYQPSASLLDYALTKAGIADFSKALAKQLIAQGVRVNAVAPGPFWTPLQPSGGQTQDKIEQFGGQVPIGRPGQPVEIAPVYVLLASQEGSYITGEVYGVTGGTGIA